MTVIFKEIYYCRNQMKTIPMKRGVIFKEIYYCRNQMKNTPMKRGLNADFKNIKIIWGSKNFFSKIFEIFLSPTWT